MAKSTISWLDESKPVSQRKIRNIETKIGFQFPQFFKEIITKHSGCTPVQSDFKYFDKYLNSLFGTGIGCFIPIQYDGYSSILYTFKNPPEFFPKSLVAFAETGNGDLICFDYRDNPTTDNPPIVYWNHEAEIGKDVSFIAKDFEEFLSMLKEPED
jgi:hypothetical protein